MGHWENRLVCLFVSLSSIPTLDHDGLYLTNARIHAVAKGKLLTLRAGKVDATVWIGCGEGNVPYKFHCKAHAQKTFSEPACAGKIREIKGIMESS